MKILAIETSTDLGSAAVVENGEVLVMETFAGARGHGSGLFVRLEQLLKGVGTIDQILVGAGPGGYSGLRVGISAAMALRMAWNVPAGGVYSVLGYDVADYQVVLDARGAWIFAAVRGGRLVAPPKMGDTASTLEAMCPDLPVFGKSPKPAQIPITPGHPSAVVLTQRFQSGQAELLPDLAPVYLKDPHITTGKQGTLFGPDRSH